MFASIDSPTEPEFRYILPEDDAAYQAWAAPYVRLFFPRVTPALYHYTTGSNLIRILGSGELWATQLNCLNDASEYLYVMGRLRAHILKQYGSRVSSDTRFLLDLILQGRISHPEAAREGRFVACFTEDGDDLSQWRAYGGGEGGYALQFDSTYLRSFPQDPPTIVLGRVEYRENVQDRFLRSVSTHTIKFFRDGLKKKRAPSREAWAEEFLLHWSSIVSMFAPFIKHPKFSSEREWRLVYHLQDEAIPRMQYLQKNSMMTKHVPLRVMLRNGQPCLPLTGITVGPCRHRRISRSSVEDLLRTSGYSVDEVHVSATQTPYQTV